MAALDRYYAAACQIDMPNPTARSGIDVRVRRMLEMVDMAVVGYEPFHDVKLIAAFMMAGTRATTTNASNPGIR